MNKRANRIDPRTVPRSRMLGQLGALRPQISIVVLAQAPFAENVETWREFVQGSARPSQLILAYCLGAEPPPDRAAIASQRQDESLIEFANRAATLGIGRLIALLPPGAGDGSEIAALAERFEADPRLGAAGFEAGVESMSGLIVREALWTALSGLETSFLGWNRAILDFCLRARAIGYAAPCYQAAQDSDAPDDRLLEERAALAPDRSGVALAPNPQPAGRFAVYTAITQNYDTLKPQPPQAIESSELLAFLDPDTAAACAGHSRGWRIAAFDPPAGDGHRGARYPKINAHLVLPDAEYSLWIDASIGIVCPFPLRRLVELFLGDCDLCVFRHYARRSIYEEAEACIAYGLDRPEIIEAQMARYRSEGLPATTGLIEAPVLLRRHTKAIRALNEAWWAEIVQGSRRDQLSFNYVAWKLGLRYETFPLSLATANGLFVKFAR
jgi:hypothetical protein